MDPRDLQKLNYTVLWLYYTGCTQKNQKKHNHPKAAAIRLTLLFFPCAQNHAPVTKIPSRQTNATDREQ